MRLATILAVLLILLGLSAALIGQVSVQQAKPPGQSAPATAELERWIEQLGHADFQVRQQAMQKLQQVGLAAIPVLEQALSKYSDPNIQRHVKELLRMVQPAPELVPTRVNLKLQEVTLEETLRALEKVTGYRFDYAALGNNNDDRVVYNWNWQNVTFWEALQQLCDHAGISYVEGWYSQDGKTIRLESGEAHPSYTCLQGPFRVTIVGFSYNRNVSFLTGPKRYQVGGTVQRHDSLNVNLRVAVEPRYAFVSVNGVNIQEAEDDQGVSRVLPRSNEAERVFAGYYYGGGRMYQQQISAALLPGNVGGKLLKFRGTINAVVIAGEYPLITVDNVHAAKGKRLEKKEVTLLVYDVNDDGQTVQLKVQVWQRTNGQLRNPNWLHTAPQRFKVYDAKGNELRPMGAMTWTTEQDSAHGTMMFQRNQAVAAGPAVGIGRILGGKPNPEEALRVVYCEWELLPTQIPFSFQDVPLP